MASHDQPAFFSLARTLRAHRSFTAEPVSDDHVALILDAATRAPSAENRQPWHFVVVRDEQRRAAIAGLMAGIWEGMAREWSRPRLDPALFDDVDRGFGGGLADAPLMVVVCGDTDLADRGVLASSIFPAVQNLLLGAHALGLGAVLTTIASTDPGPIGEIVAAPDSLRPMAVVPIGHPARVLGPSRRVAVGDKASLDTVGTPWPGAASS